MNRHGTTDLHPWQAPSVAERRPLALSGVIFIAIVAVTLLTTLVTRALGLPVLAQREIATLVQAGGAIVVLTKWRAWGAAGFNRPRHWRDLWVVALPAVVALWPVAFGINVALPALAVALLMELPNSFAEEALIRGITLRALRNRGNAVAIAVSAAGFGLLHFVVLIFGQPFSAVLPIVIIGGLFGVCYAGVRIRTNTIWAPIALHMAFNIFEGIGRGPEVIGEGPATAILLASAVVLPIYGAVIVRSRRLSTLPPLATANHG